MRAQDVFTAMMKEQVAPALRQLGLKGSGQSFSIPSDRYWALVGFQKSRSSDSRIVKFTINLHVISREAWTEARETHPWMPDRPTANSGYPVQGWDKRIGHLLRDQSDHWWSIGPDQAVESVARAVIEAIRDRALPAMYDQMA